MSQESLELVRRIQPSPDVDLAALMRNDASWHSSTDLLAPVFHPEFEAVGMTGLQRSFGVGIDALRALWLDWLEPWESYRTEVEDLLDAGDGVVVVLVRDYGRRTGMDAEIRVDGAAIWTVRRGKIVRAAFYGDRKQALDAVGLSK